MKSGNPTLNDKVFKEAAAGWSGQVMTLNGTVGKASLLTALLVAGAGWTWHIAATAGAPAVMPWVLCASIAGFVIALATIFIKTWAPLTSPAYAVFEGLALGGISALMEMKYPGVVLPAVGLTMGVLVAMLLAYTSRLVRATENFKLGVIAATGGICIYYLVAMVMGFFGMHAPLIYDSGWLGIGFSVVVVIVAALNLVLDFDFIETGVTQRAPKYMEWYAAFGLMVTMVWLYMEMLRLMSKLRSRN